MGRQDPVPVTGIWLRRIGSEIHVLAELDGEWRLVIVDTPDGPISHIVEPAGMLQSPIDRITRRDDAG